MCEATGSSQRVIGRRLDRSQGKWPSGIAGVAISVVNCRICDLIYPNPLPLPASIEDHYGIDPEEYWSPEYFSEDDKYFSDQISTFRRLSNGKVRPIALDIGAGLGKCMAALNRAGFEAFGIEGSRSFFKAAAEKGVVGVDHLTSGYRSKRRSLRNRVSTSSRSARSSSICMIRRVRSDVPSSG